MTRRTFVDLFQAGEVLEGAVSDFIAEWHDLPDDSPDASLEVYEYLGMTWEQYSYWGLFPGQLGFILNRR